MQRRHLLRENRILQQINSVAEARAYMTDIKPVIDNLAKLLAQFGFTKVPAEVFRQAKFDKENACSYLWHLLAELLQSKQSYWAFPSTKTDFVEHSSAGDEDVAVFVKHNLIAENYPHAVALYSSAECGSRNLLLAFGWFIAENNVVDRLLELRLEKLATKFEIDLTKTTFHSAPNLLEIMTKTTNTNLDVREICQRLIWHNGKTKLMNKNLLNVQQERTKLISKILALPTLELFEHAYVPLNLQINLLKQPKLQMKFLKQLNEETNFLKMFLKWKEKEHVFWRWMSSVADIHSISLQQPDNIHGNLDIVLKFSREQCEQFIKYCLRCSLMDIRHYSTTKQVITQYFFKLEREDSRNMLISTFCDEFFRKEAQLRIDLQENQRLATELFRKLFYNLKGVICIPPKSSHSIKH